MWLAFWASSIPCWIKPSLNSDIYFSLIKLQSKSKIMTHEKNSFLLEYPFQGAYFLNVVCTFYKTCRLSPPEKKVIKRNKPIFVVLNSVYCCLHLQSPYTLGVWKIKEVEKLCFYCSDCTLWGKLDWLKHLHFTYLTPQESPFQSKELSHSWSCKYLFCQPHAEPQFSHSSLKKHEESFPHRVPGPVPAGLPCKKLWWTRSWKGPQQGLSRALLAMLL